MLKNARAILLVMSMVGLGCTADADNDVARPGTGGQRGDGSGGTSAGSGGVTSSGGVRGSGSGGMTASTGGVNGTGGGSGGLGSGGALAASGGASVPATGGSATGGAVGSGGIGQTSGTGGRGSGGGGAGGAHPGTGGTGTAGSGGPGGASSAPAPTFTMIYNTIIMPTCGGSRCHSKAPYAAGLNLGTKPSAYTVWSDYVTPGDGEDSSMFQMLYFAIMPKDKDPLTNDQLLMVKDWIDAGALNN